MSCNGREQQSPPAPLRQPDDIVLPRDSVLSAYSRHFFDPSRKPYIRDQTVINSAVPPYPVQFHAIPLHAVAQHPPSPFGLSSLPGLAPPNSAPLHNSLNSRSPSSQQHASTGFPCIPKHFHHSYEGRNLRAVCPPCSMLSSFA